MRRGRVTTPGAVLGPSLFSAPAYRDAAEREAVREAYEERAAIIEHDGGEDRATAERWARACVERVPGAVPGLDPERVRLLVASGALRRAP